MGIAQAQTLAGPVIGSTGQREQVMEGCSGRQASRGEACRVRENAEGSGAAQLLVSKEVFFQQGVAAFDFEGLAFERCRG